MIDMEKLELTQEWDKVFPQSDKVEHSKVTFTNRYGITLAADMYIPKNAEGKLPASPSQQTCTSRRMRKENCRQSQ